MKTIKIEFLIIIPCRRNSSRVKFKNRRLINNKKLYEITIEQAIKFENKKNRVVVNTDDEEILNYCIINNISFYKRKKIFSSNKSRVSESIIDMIKYKYPKDKYEIKNIMLLQVTSPLRSELDIKKSLRLYKSKNYKSLCSVSESSVNLEWLNTLNKNKSLLNFLPKKYLNINSQDLPKSYGVNGAVFISDLPGYFKYKRFFNRPNSIAYVMPESNSLDIDTEFDFKMCKAFMEMDNL